MKKTRPKTLKISLGLILHSFGSVGFMLAAFEVVCKQIGIKTTIDKVLLGFMLMGIFYYVAMDAVEKARNWDLIPKRHPQRGR